MKKLTPLYAMAKVGQRPVKGNLQMLIANSVQDRWQPGQSPTDATEPKGSGRVQAARAWSITHKLHQGQTEARSVTSQATTQQSQQIPTDLDLHSSSS